MNEGEDMRLTGKRGSVILIVALAMTVLMGSAALVVDVGMAYSEKAHLANTLDAAAIAGAMELIENPDQARAVTEQYLVANNVNPANAIITIDPDEGSVLVEATVQVDHYFARVLGNDSSDVGGRSKALAGQISSVIEKNIKPFAVQDTVAYVKGKDYRIKSSASELSIVEEGNNKVTGRFGYANITGDGNQGVNPNKDVIPYIEGGLVSTLKVGDPIYTATGNMSSIIPSVENIISLYSSHTVDTPGSPRIWLIPTISDIPEKNN